MLKVKYAHNSIIFALYTTVRDVDTFQHFVLSIYEFFFELNQ